MTRIIIIGAGIAGLGAAIALKRAELDVAVYEREPELSAVGAGLTLWPNAVNALRRLGVADAVLQAGARLTSGSVQSWRGGPHISSGLDMERLFGAPALGVHRTDLQQILLDAADPATVRLGTRCVGFEQTPEGVDISFANGRTESADVLLGADGIHSAVRQTVLGTEQLRSEPWIAWRGVCSDLPPPADTNITIGPGAHYGYLPVGAARTYWFAVTEPAVKPGELLHRFQDWTEPIPSLIQSTPAQNVIRSELIDRPPGNRWGSGRVTLVGDAAHPMLPGLGQGACQALEDAVAIADCVRHATDPESGLRRYESMRIARTGRVANQSRLALQMMQWHHPMARALRSLLLRMPGEMLLRRQRWLYAYR